LENSNTGEENNLKNSIERLEEEVKALKLSIKSCVEGIEHCVKNIDETNNSRNLGKSDIAKQKKEYEENLAN